MSKRIITHLSKVDVIMGGLIEAHGPYRLVREADCHPFESLARAIAHQQLHAAAASSILKRFVATCGSGTFPSPRIVLDTRDESLRASGLSFAKIKSLKDLAAKTIADVVPDRQTLVELEDEEIISRLTQVRGIGRWTVEMMLMFQLGRPDVLPVDDFGVRNGFRLAYGLRKMPAPRVLAAFGERWAPHRTAAAWYLWRVADMKRAGTLPEPRERVRMPRLQKRRRKVPQKPIKAPRTTVARAGHAKASVRKVRPRPARK